MNDSSELAPSNQAESGPTVKSYHITEQGKVSFVEIEIARLEQLNRMLDVILTPQTLEEPRFETPVKENLETLADAWDRFYERLGSSATPGEEAQP